MPRRVLAIKAKGTRGKVKGLDFFAESRRGKYVLHSEHRAKVSGKPLRFAANKVLVDSLDEAAKLLASGGYHIRVFNSTHKQWNLRAVSAVEIITR